VSYTLSLDYPIKSGNDRFKKEVSFRGRTGVIGVSLIFFLFPQEWGIAGG